MSSSIVLSAAVVLSATLTYQALLLVFRRSPLGDIRGPPSASFIFGNFRQVQADDDEQLTERWLEEYGHVVVHKGLFGSNTLVTDDLRAIQYVLAHSDTFTKSRFARRLLHRVLGGGLLVAEGAPHRAQRRVLNPAFGPVQVRELSGIFLDKANELRDVWASKISHETGQAELNAADGLSAATLDIIGLAGFGYTFDTLARPADDPSELSAAFGKFIGRGRSRPLNLLLGLVPGMERLVQTRAARGRRQARAIMERIGRELIQERKTAATVSGKAEAGGRDLLSLLVRANLSDENSDQRLSDDEVLSQIPTFLLAGHETTSTAMSWVLFELAQHPALQLELRSEARAFPLPPAARDNAPLDAETLAALDKLPLLDAVVRETLRLHAPVQRSGRVATADAEIPLARPFVDARGVRQDVVRVAKGDQFTIPILLVQRSTALWGEDAREWKPERWFAGAPEAAHAVPGVWSHLLTFLGGQHACIGYRFSLLETKILLHALVAAFNFELAVPTAEITKKSGVVTRPILRSAPEKGTQLPLILSLADAE